MEGGTWSLWSSRLSTSCPNFSISRARKGVKCPGYAPGGMWKLWFDWYISHAHVRYAWKLCILQLNLLPITVTFSANDLISESRHYTQGQSSGGQTVSIIINNSNKVNFTYPESIHSDYWHISDCADGLCYSQQELPWSCILVVVVFVYRCNKKQ